jgi:DNA-binding MarR family transcriptional regulator
VAFDTDDVTDALLVASRALVAVAARSLASVDSDVTLSQYRALVVLASRGPQTVGQLADEIGVHASTATRLCDRLVSRRLITRVQSAANRRETHITLSVKGRRLVDDVTRRRRHELRTIVRRLPAELTRPMIVALNAFADAAGEVPEQDWSLGWQ